MTSPFENLGVITLLMMQNPIYGQRSLAEIHSIVLPPLSNQLAVTATRPGDTETSPPVPMAFALFAKLNDSWDAKMRDPGFDIARLPPEAWTSGGNKWMVAFLSTQKASGGFVERAARAIWSNGGTLHLRGVDTEGKAEIAKRRF